MVRSSSTWWAAGLTAIAVALIGWPARNSGRTSAKGILLAIASAAAFSLLDSMVPHFSHQTDPVRMLFCIFGSLGLLTLVLMPWKEEALFRRSKLGDSWAWGSGFPHRLTGSTDVHCDCLLPGTYRGKCCLFEPWVLDHFICCLARQMALPERGISHSLDKSTRLAGSILLGICILLIT